MSTLTAGVARANIMPPVGSNTWGKPADGIAGELFAKALVLDDGRASASQPPPISKRSGPTWQRQ